MGLTCIGPQAPNGRQAQPWPAELPQDSVNVPTFHTNRQTPATATATATPQLDFVFASEPIADQVSAAARNGMDEWGPSDHCRIETTPSPSCNRIKLLDLLDGAMDRR